MGDGDELRAELAEVAASLRAYLEQQAGSGATGIPRGHGPTVPSHASSPLPAPPPVLAIAPPAPPATAAPAPPPPLAAVSPPAPAPPPLAAAALPSPSPSPATADLRLRLPQLAQEIASCTRCKLASTRTKTVFARGNPSASLCFIGEAPGAEEDAQGLPFVGRAGQLLDKMIQAMGLVPERDVYIVNILRCRPPGNRKPEPEEITACLPYLHEQLDLVRPKVIVALGNTSVGTLLNTQIGISKLRGQWKLYRGSVLVMPTYHPSYLLRPGPQQTESKKQAWEDLQAVMKELNLPLPKPKRRAGALSDREEEDPS